MHRIISALILAVTTALCRRRRSHQACRQSARPPRGRSRRHPLGHRRQVPAGTLALAGNLADEQGRDQEPAPHLSGRHRRSRPLRRQSAAQDRCRSGSSPRFMPRPRRRRFPAFRPISSNRSSPSPWSSNPKAWTRRPASSPPRRTAFSSVTATTPSSPASRRRHRQLADLPPGKTPEGSGHQRNSRLRGLLPRQRQARPAGLPAVIRIQQAKEEIGRATAWCPPPCLISTPTCPTSRTPPSPARSSASTAASARPGRCRWFRSTRAAAKAWKRAMWSPSTASGFPKATTTPAAGKPHSRRALRPGLRLPDFRADFLRPGDGKRQVGHRRRRRTQSVSRGHRAGRLAAADPGSRPGRRDAEKTSSPLWFTRRNLRLAALLPAASP